VFNAEELVDVLVHLVTDLFTRQQAHHHELRVLSGEYHAAKVRVLQTLFLNVSHVCNIIAVISYLLVS